MSIHRKELLVIAGRLTEGEEITTQDEGTPLSTFAMRLCSDPTLSETQLALMVVFLAQSIERDRE